MEFNQMQKLIERKNDIEMGQQMALAAKQSIQGEEEFASAKRERAAHLLKSQWNEQVKLKNNESIVDRIFS